MKPRSLNTLRKSDLNFVIALAHGPWQAWSVHPIVDEGWPGQAPRITRIHLRALENAEAADCVGPDERHVPRWNRCCADRDGWRRFRRARQFAHLPLSERPAGAPHSGSR